MVANLLMATVLGVGAQPAPPPHDADPRLQKPWWGEPVEFGNGSRVWLRAMTADGKRAIVSDRLGMVCVEFAPPRIVWYRKAEPVHVAPRSVAFSPDGKLLATAESEDGANLYDAQTGTPIELFFLEGAAGEKPGQVGFLPDGKLVLCTVRQFHAPDKDSPRPPAGTWVPHNSVSYSLIVWDPVTKKELRRTHEVFRCDDPSIRLELLGTGQILEISTARYQKGKPSHRTARYIEPLTGASSPEMALDKDDGRSLGMSPDGRTLLTMTSGQAPRLVDVPTGKVTFRLEGHKRPVTDAAMSNDGKLIATVSGGYPERFSELYPDGKLPDGPAEVFLWEAATARVIARCQFPATGNGFGHVEFSPDGKFVVVMSGWAGGERTLALGQFPFPRPKASDRVGIPVIPLPEPQKPAAPAALPAPQVPPPAGGGLVADALDKLAEELPRSNRSAAQQIDALYLAALGRLPTAAEAKKVSDMYRTRLSADVLRKILAELAKSPEFEAHVKTLQKRVGTEPAGPKSSDIPGFPGPFPTFPGTNPWPPSGFPILPGGVPKKP